MGTTIRLNGTQAKKATVQFEYCWQELPLYPPDPIPYCKFFGDGVALFLNELSGI